MPSFSRPGSSVIDYNAVTGDSVTTAAQKHDIAVDDLYTNIVDGTTSVKGIVQLGTTATTAALGNHLHTGVYAPAAEGVTNGNTHDHSGGDGAQIAYSGLSGLPTLGTAAAVDTGTGAGDVPILDAGGKLDPGVLPEGSGEDTTARDLAVFNSFLNQIDLGRASGAIPSGYMHLFLTDELATKTNATYDAAGDYYGNVSGGGLSAPNNLTAHSTSAFSSGEYSSAFAAWKACDGADKTTSTNGWQSPNDGTVIGEFIGRHFGSTGHLVGRMLIWNSQYATVWRNGVKDIVVEGSNDAVANGSGGLSTLGTWTKIPVLAVTGGTIINTDEAQINQGAGTGVDATAELTLGGGTAYKAVRLRCTSASWGGGSPDFAQTRELEMYDAVVADITLVPTAITAGSAPDTVNFYMLHKAVDAVTLNTDLKARVSRDNGSNWSAHVTLAEVCQYDADYKLLKGTADLSALASGTSVKWEITTLNTKSQRVRAAAMILNS